MIDMNIRSGGSSGLHLAYAVGRFEGENNAFVINRLGGESPLGSLLCSLGSDYAVCINPDGSGRSICEGLDVTSSRGDGKAWYIKDTATGEVWSPFFFPTCRTVDDFEVAYLPGLMSAFSLKHKIACTITVAVVPDNPCEIWRVRIENRSASVRTLTFTTYVEPSIGPQLETGYVDKHNLLLMGRPLSSVIANGRIGRDLVVFHSSTLVPIRFETDKAEFIGNGRTLRNPKHLDADAECGRDGLSENAVASLTVAIELPVEGEAEFAFCFGVASGAEEAARIARAYSKMSNVNEAIDGTIRMWRDLCSTVQVHSQDRGFDALVNTWLPYEAYAGWMKHRTGGVCLDPWRAADTLRRFYALAGTASEKCRRSLLDFASGISVSNSPTALRIGSPDSESVLMLPTEELLWLATCTAHYVAETGDSSILDERVVSHHSTSLTLRDHCERIMRMGAANGSLSGGLLEQTSRLWSLVSEIAPDFPPRVWTPTNRRHAETVSSTENEDEHPEERTLPRRVRYFQSATPVLANGQGAQEIDRLFGHANGPDGESAAACGVYWVMTEHILGLEATPQGLRFRPRLPQGWQECSITRRFREDTYSITIRRAIRPSKKGTSIVVDGEPVLGDTLPYIGDGLEHRVEVLIS